MKKYRDLNPVNTTLNWIFDMLKKVSRFIRNKLPKGIYYRFLLIVCIPLLLTQLIFFYIFFDRYWTNTSKQNVDILTREIYILNKRYDELLHDKKSNTEIVRELAIFTDIDIYFSTGKTLNSFITYSEHNNIFYNPIRQLKNELYVLNSGRIDFYRQNEDYYVVEIEKDDGILSFQIQKNRIFIKRVDLIIFWNLFTFFVVSTISLIFLKNQIRSVEKLKDFANDFSYLEKDNTSFKPTGAKEIREMGNAFINVVHKMKQLINNRTTMLAQISHDLRTPLTRMKLQIEFIENQEIANYFRQDLEEMEKLINEYLLFAKGESGDKFRKVNIKNFFDIIINEYSRSHYNINIRYDLKQRTARLKIDSFKRCINNLINNALKYYKNKINITVKTTDNTMLVNVEDDGCGISKEFINKVKMPFYKLNNNIKGMGLGLSIVQNIVNMHHGRMFFKTSSLGGLNVELVIPIKKE